jgi:hypothetical protein
MKKKKTLLNVENIFSSNPINFNKNIKIGKVKIFENEEKTSENIKKEYKKVKKKKKTISAQESISEYVEIEKNLTMEDDEELEINLELKMKRKRKESRKMMEYLEVKQHWSKYFQNDIFK